MAGRDIQSFLNARNELYRERDMKNHPPEHEEAVLLLAQHVNLLRRPLLRRGETIVFGFDESEYRRLAAPE